MREKEFKEKGGKKKGSQRNPIKMCKQGLTF